MIRLPIYNNECKRIFIQLSVDMDQIPYYNSDKASIVYNKNMLEKLTDDFNNSQDVSKLVYIGCKDQYVQGEISNIKEYLDKIKNMSAIFNNYECCGTIDYANANGIYVKLDLNVENEKILYDLIKNNKIFAIPMIKEKIINDEYICSINGFILAFGYICGQTLFV